MLYRFLGISLVILLTLACCPEKPPVIVPCQTDRVVLVEEFTGIKCPNCPIGHAKLERLAQEHPGKFIVVGIHGGHTSTPYYSWDFRTPDGTAIYEYYKPPFEPTAIINRKQFEGEASPILERDSWAGRITEEICLPPDAAITINSSFDDATREVTIVTEVNPTNSVIMDENVGLTVLITEDHIIAPQKTTTIIEPDYDHKHVLRDILTDTWGTKIENKGSVLNLHKETITYTVPQGWNADNCNVVAFVHYQGDDRYVLQAAETKLK